MTSILDIILDAYKSDKKQDELKKLEDAGRKEDRKLKKKWIKNHSITCKKCNNLAKPIKDTLNRYRCDSCGSQFAGPAHTREYYSHQFGGKFRERL